LPPASAPRHGACSGSRERPDGVESGYAQLSSYGVIRTLFLVRGVTASTFVDQVKGHSREAELAITEPRLDRARAWRLAGASASTTQKIKIGVEAEGKESARKAYDTAAARWRELREAAERRDECQIKLGHMTE